MDNMILGRYIPGNSIIHRLDPRSKLVAMILLIIIAFGPIIQLQISYSSLQQAYLSFYQKFPYLFL